MAKSKSAIKKDADNFNRKYKVGSKVNYKDAFGGVTGGTVKAGAVAQETQASFYINEAPGKISTENVVSK